MKKQQLRSKDIADKVAQYKYEVSKKDNIELYDNKVIVINKESLFFFYKDKILPTLKFLLKSECLKKITVDMGAIKFVTNGADIMRPGITNIEPNIEKDEPIVIIDETHKKPLAVGIALHNSEEMQKINSGKVIKNIHYVGDEIWKI